MWLKDSQKFEKNAGFTLIEMLIAVAIVAILAAVALPAYNEQVRKARRADAQSALTGLSVAMERYYTEQSPSTYVGAAVGSSGIYPNEAPLDGTNKFYTLSIASQSATAYTINAAPKNAQSRDACGTFSLTHTGVKAVSASTLALCWR